MLKLKRIMRQRIRGIIEGRPLTEEEVTRILGIDSDEDEEGNQNPKPLFGGHRAGAAKGKTKASDVARGENSTVSHRNDEMDEEDDEEGDEDGEWEAEVGPEAAMLASEWVAEKVDKRVDQFMTEFMRHEREFGDDQEEQPVEDDFDVLGESSDEEQ